METVIILMMILVGVSFVLKLTFMPLWQMTIESAVVAVMTLSSVDSAILQSKTQIVEWLNKPELMLDMAVILTIDIILQIAFCMSQASETGGIREKIYRSILLHIPGLIISPVCFYLLVYLMFYFTGSNFYTVGYSLATFLFLLLPLLAIGLKHILPEKTSRLELIFYINCILGMLGNVATVNGQTATIGINETNVSALATITVISLIGSIWGFLIFKRKINKQL